MSSIRKLVDFLLGRKGYTKTMRLRGPPCPNALAFGPQGRLLACGGDDGVRIWDLPEGDPYQIPDFDPKILGQVTALRWIHKGTLDTPQMLIGSSLGSIILWKHDATEDRFRETSIKDNAQAGAVEAISVDDSKFAVIYRQQMVISYVLEENGLVQMWMHHFTHTIPRSVAHLEGDVLVWGHTNGVLHRLKGGTGKEIDVRIFPEQIGCAAYRQVKGRIEYALDILDDGCKIYRGTDTKEAYRFCRVPRVLPYVVCKQILWIEDERYLAVGSDHGKVYIFNEESSGVQKLKHGSQDEIVQTLAVSKSATQFMLATTSMEGDGTVRVWTKERKSLSLAWEVFRVILYLVTAMMIIRSVLLAVSDIIHAPLFWWKWIANHTKNITGGQQLPSNILNLFRRALRVIVNLLWKFGKDTWTWLQKDDGNKAKMVEKGWHIARYRQHVAL